MKNVQATIHYRDARAIHDAVKRLLEATQRNALAIEALLKETKSGKAVTITRYGETPNGWPHVSVEGGRPIEDLGLTPKLLQRLRDDIGLVTIGAILEKTQEEMQKYRLIGVKKIQEIHAALIKLDKGISTIPPAVHRTMPRRKRW